MQASFTNPIDAARLIVIFLGTINFVASMVLAGKFVRGHWVIRDEEKREGNTWVGIMWGIAGFMYALLAYQHWTNIGRGITVFILVDIILFPTAIVGMYKVTRTNRYQMNKTRRPHAS